MKKYALLAGLAVGALFIGSSPASAAPPTSATGTATRTSFTVTSLKTVGDVTFFTFDQDSTITGTIAGTAFFSGSCMQGSTGPIRCVAAETFTGTALGRSGTLEVANYFTIDPVTLANKGVFASVRGTGGLAGAHVRGTFAGQGDVADYTAEIVLAP